VNGKLSEHPELLNQDPYGEGWLFEVKITKPEEIKELLDKNQYEEYLKGISGE
jgi:glycine cleavage system H protein